MQSHLPFRVVDGDTTLSTHDHMTPAMSAAIAHHGEHNRPETSIVNNLGVEIWRVSRLQRNPCNAIRDPQALEAE